MLDSKVFHTHLSVVRQNLQNCFNPTIVVGEGDLVVDAKYLNMVPPSQCW
jgi:hypothetical protein